MSSSLGTLAITLKADTGQFHVQLQAANNDIEAINKRIQAFARETDNSLKPLKNFPGQLAKVGQTAALAGGALDDLGGQVGKVGAKLGGIAAMAVSGGAVGVAMAAFTAAVALASLGLEQLYKDAGIGEEALKKIADAAAETAKRTADVKNEIGGLNDQLAGIGRSSADAALINAKLALADMDAQLQDSQEQWDKMLGVMRDASILTEGQAIAAVQAAQKQHEENVKLKGALEDKVRVLEEVKRATDAQAAADKRAQAAAKALADAQRDLADSFQKAYDEQMKREEETQKSSAAMFGAGLDFANKPTGNLAGPVLENTAFRTRVEGPGAGTNIQRERLAAELNDLSNTIDSQGSRLGDALANAAMTFVSKAGEMGRVIQAGIQGAQAAGPWGAIIAVLAELLSHAEAFGDIVAMFDETIYKLVNELNPLIEGLKPMSTMFASMIGGLGQVLGLFAQLIGGIVGSLGDTGLALQAFNDGTEVLFEVIRYVAIGILNIVWAIGQVFNAIIRTIATVVGYFSDKAADAVRSWQVNIGSINDKIRGLQDEEYDRKRADATHKEPPPPTNDLKNFGDGIREATEELTNIPQGFKIARFRYEASNPATTGGAGMAGAAAGGTTINGLTIYAWDIKAAFEQVQRMAAQKNFQQSGSSQTFGMPFGAPDNGAG